MIQSASLLLSISHSDCKLAKSDANSDGDIKWLIVCFFNAKKQKKPHPDRYRDEAFITSN